MKRKNKADEEEEVVAEDQHEDEEEDEDEEENEEDKEEELIDVDFEFMDPKEIDFLGLKTLMRQLFSNDAELFNLSELADIIIGQPELGSVVKVDDATDPYAVMTIVSLSEHKNKASIQALVKYLVTKGSKAVIAGKTMEQMINSSHAGFLLNERLVNMPPQIAPPLLKMLLEEMEWRVEEKKTRPFDYIVVMSKTYTDVQPVAEDDEPKKKKRKGKKPQDQTVYHFQPEDEIFEQCSAAMFECPFSLAKNEDSPGQSLEEVGIRPGRRVYVIKSDKLPFILEQIKTRLI